MTGNVCSELCIYKGRHVETGSVHAKDQDDSDRGQVHGPPEGQLLGGHDPADCLAALIDDINSGYENDQQIQGLNREKVARKSRNTVPASGATSQ